LKSKHADEVQVEDNDDGNSYDDEDGNSYDGYTAGSGDGDEDGDDNGDVGEGYQPPSSSSSLRNNRYHRLEGLRMRVQAVRHMLLLYLPPATGSHNDNNDANHNDHHSHINNVNIAAGVISTSSQHKDKGSFFGAITTPSTPALSSSSSSLPYNHPHITYTTNSTTTTTTVATTATTTTTTAATPNSLLSSFAAMAGSWLGSHFTTNSAYHKQVRTTDLLTSSRID
jgi:hypothetical protein